jgi:hypothetical protein
MANQKKNKFIQNLQKILEEKLGVFAEGLKIRELDDENGLRYQIITKRGDKVIVTPNDDNKRIEEAIDFIEDRILLNEESEIVKVPSRSHGLIKVDPPPFTKTKKR